jgi:hypothetical protein
VVGQVSLDDVGEWHGAPSCPGLGRPEGRSAAELFDELADYPDRAGVKVDVAGAERGQFGPSQAGEGAQQHERAVSRVDRGSQVVDLRDGQARGQARSARGEPPQSARPLSSDLARQDLAPIRRTGKNPETCTIKSNARRSPGQAKPNRGLSYARSMASA